jgi:tetratricopeptide (TPR) repeat protein
MVLFFGAIGLAAAVSRLEEPLTVAPAPRRALAPTPERLAPGAVGLLFLIGVALAGLSARPARASEGADGGSPLAKPGRVVGALAGQAFLNLGAVELDRAILDDGVPSLVRQQRQNAAEGLLQQALQLDPDSLGAYRNLAQLAALRARPVDARRFLGEARSRAPENDDLFYFQAGRIYRETGSVDLTLSAWSRVDPKMGTWSCSGTYLLLVRWALELHQAERYDTAARVDQAAIRIRPDEPAPYQLLTTILAASGGDRAVEDAMKEQVRLHPDVLWPNVELYTLYMRTGRIDQAEEWQRRGDAINASAAWQATWGQRQQERRCLEYLPRSLTTYG